MSTQTQTDPPISALQLLEERKRSGSLPGRRDDGRTVALVIEGGGMRSIAAAAMSSALERLGLRDSFDCVYGSSAGALAGAYFIAGQALSGTRMLFEIVGDKNLIDLRRILRGRPAVSLEFLLDDVCVTRHPLAFDEFLRSGIPLHVIATSLERKGAVIFRNFSTQSELLEALRASSRIPFFAGPPVVIGSERYLDSSLYVSIPFRMALADGATDIVILLNRPAGTSRNKPNLFERIFVIPYLRKLGAEFAGQYRRRAEIYNSELEAIEIHVRSGALPEIVPIRMPAGTPSVAAFDMSRARLLAAADAGFAATYQTLGHPPPPPDYLRETIKGNSCR